MLSALARRGSRGFLAIARIVRAAAIPSGLVDVVMFPVGPYVDQRYIEEILPLAREYHVGTVCFKTFGAGKCSVIRRATTNRCRSGQVACTVPEGRGHAAALVGAAVCALHTHLRSRRGALGVE